MNAEGRVLASAEEKTTPEKLLKLYFKEIYIEKPLKTETDILDEESTENQLAELSEEIFEQNDDPLIFDEEEGKKIAEECVLLGKELDFPEKKLKELEHAGLYHKIGYTQFKNSDLKSKDFKKKMAAAGYEILLNEMNTESTIAEAVRDWVKNYSAEDFNLKDEIPCAHIIKIVSSYNKLEKKMGSENALDEMLRIGSNSFNPFVLHKFVRLKKEENDRH